MNRTMKTAASKASERIYDITVAIGAAVGKTLLWLSRRVWKRYLGIETPLYKWWWKRHCEYMQQKLDDTHSPYLTSF